MLRRRNSAGGRPTLGFASAVVMCCLMVCSFPVFSSSPALSSLALASGANAAPHPPTVRWSEAQPGCTFSRDDDGKYRYGMWSGDVGVVLAVDAREVQIIRHRIEPIFGVLLTLRYRGAGSVDSGPGGVTLQFVKHFKAVQTSLDPDDYTQKIQADADALDAETRRA